MYVCPIPIAASPTCAAGPATAQLAWVDDFIADAVEAGAPPDFISSHLYPTDPWANEQALSHGRDDFFGAIESAANNVATSGRKHGLPSTTPFLLTEFSEYLNNVMIACFLAAHWRHLYSATLSLFKLHVICLCCRRLRPWTGLRRFVLLGEFHCISRPQVARYCGKGAGPVLVSSQCHERSTYTYTQARSDACSPSLHLNLVLSSLLYTCSSWTFSDICAF